MSEPSGLDWAPAPGGVTVTASDQAALLADLSAHIEQGRGFAVATLNLDHAVKLRRDPAFRNAYSGQTHVTADGRPVVWLSRLSGQDVSLVTGSDLVEPAMAMLAAKGTPVGFFGATDEVLAAASARLTEQFPGLQVVSAFAPPMGFDPQGAEADAAIARLADEGAKVVFLALGAPKQEVFAARAHAAHPDIGFLSVGAGIDFIAGSQTRAPAWVRAIAAEWVWRLLGNPARLAGRYASCAVILPGLALKALRQRFR